MFSRDIFYDLIYYLATNLKENVGVLKDLQVIHI